MGLEKKKIVQQEKKDLEKLKGERLKDYGEIMRLDKNSPLIHGAPIPARDSFDWKKYDSGIRDVLYKNIHLFDDFLVSKIIQIDGERIQIELVGDEEIYLEKMYAHYQSIEMFILDEMRGNDVKYYE